MRGFGGGDVISRDFPRVETGREHWHVGWWAVCAGLVARTWFLVIFHELRMDGRIDTWAGGLYAWVRWLERDFA